MQQYEPLFLKYRPQSLADLVGQEYVRRTLTNAIEHNRISLAYLFTGPRGIGKTSSARILAKCLNCEQGPTANPCQVCTSCLEIKQGNSPSVLEIDAASNNSVDDARVLIERAPLVAPGGRYKLYIIDECHMLTKEAFNALLKTIEEPPANVIFVLATTEEHKVPQTIVSRCQRLIFRLVNAKSLTAHLSEIAKNENIQIETEAVDLIARRSSGGMRDALGLLDQASLLRPSSESISIQDLTLLLGALEEDVLLSMGEHVLAQDSGATIELAHQLLNEGKEPYIIASELAKHMLNLVKAAYINETLRANTSSDSSSQTIATGGSVRASLSGSVQYVEKVIEMAVGLDRFEMAQIIEQLDRLEQACKRSSQPVLSLEIGLLSLCHRLDFKALKNIESRLVALETGSNYGHLDHLQTERSQSHSAAGVQENKAETSKPINAKVESFKNERPSAGQEESSFIKEQLKPKIETNTEAPIMASVEKVENEPKVASIVEGDLNNFAHEAAPGLKQPNEEQSPKFNETDDDLDAVWVDLLDELQKRHLPTFSLVSTHAFPVSVSQGDLVLGVHFENFQKMIDSKAVYLNEASQAVLKRKVVVKTRVVSKPKASPALKTGPIKARTQEPAPAGKVAEDSQRVNSDSSIVSGRVSNSTTGDEELGTIHTNSEQRHVEEAPMREPASNGINITQEAYGLFEGPGSRLITASNNEGKT